MYGKDPAATVTKGCCFHHVGFVGASIANVGHSFAKSLGAKWDGEITYDPLQSANISLLRHNSHQNPAIELVEPVGPDSPPQRFLNAAAVFTTCATRWIHVSAEEKY